jgi:hypothetical protein
LSSRLLTSAGRHALTFGSCHLADRLPAISAGSPRNLQARKPGDPDDRFRAEDIIHDWPDDEAVEILENVRASTGDGARLILVESVIPPHHRDFSTKGLDLEMLVGNAGRERTADEHRILLQKAGFQMTRVILTASPFSLVEAAPSG